MFPGGRVEDADADPALVDALESDPHHRAVAERRCAVRETAEETGLALDPSSLVRLSHWTPPAESPTRYSTAFFVAPAPPGTVHLDRESSSHEWLTPAAALDRHAAGAFELTPPTFVTLHQLIDVIELVSVAPPGPTGRPDPTALVVREIAARRTEHFTTRIASTEDSFVALYHGDAGYERSDADAEGPRHRVWMSPAGWRYERTTQAPGPDAPSIDPVDDQPHKGQLT